MFVGQCVCGDRATWAGVTLRFWHVPCRRAVRARNRFRWTDVAHYRAVAEQQRQQQQQQRSKYTLRQRQRCSFICRVAILRVTGDTGCQNSRVSIAVGCLSELTMTIAPPPPPTPTRAINLSSAVRGHDGGDFRRVSAFNLWPSMDRGGLASVLWPRPAPSIDIVSEAAAELLGAGRRSPSCTTCLKKSPLDQLDNNIFTARYNTAKTCRPIPFDQIIHDAALHLHVIRRYTWSWID